MSLKRITWTAYAMWKHTGIPIHTFLYGPGAAEPDPDVLMGFQIAFAEYSALQDGLLQEFMMAFAAGG